MSTMNSIEPTESTDSAAAGRDSLNDSYMVFANSGIHVADVLGEATAEPAAPVEQSDWFLPFLTCIQTCLRAQPQQAWSQQYEVRKPSRRRRGRHLSYETANQVAQRGVPVLHQDVTD